MADDTAHSSSRRGKKIPRIEKSLAILLKSLIGTAVVIELKNDSEISGVVEDADEGMSVLLVDVTIVSPSVRSVCLFVCFLSFF